MGKTILIVEDEQNVLKVLTSRIKSVGYDVETVCDGEEAINAYAKSLNSKPYDLMLIDILMPKVSGTEVVKYIRNKEEEHDVASEDRMPIIVLSSFRQLFLEELGKTKIEHIVKPYDSKELIKKIEEKIGKP